MKITLSKRVSLIKLSPILALSTQANQLKAQGKKIINMTIGEPDFDTPEFIKEAANKALRDGLTKYTAVAGILSLRVAIAEKLLRENKLSYTPEQVIVSHGVKHSLYNLMQVLLNPGDEVIIPAPYWTSYPDMALLAGGKPVIVSTSIEQNFKLSAEQLKKAITPKTRLLMINSPCNPTGVVYHASELAALAEVLLQHPNVCIASDDIYEHIYWGKKPFVNILNVCPELYERTVVLNGASKAYAMTGWRVGYAAGAKEIIKGMEEMQSQSTGNVNTLGQAGLEAALRGDQGCVEVMRQAYEKRYKYVTGYLNKIKGVRCAEAEGAFYSFAEIELLKSGKMSGEELSKQMLEIGGVAIVPGSAFGTSSSVRISCGGDEEELREGMVGILRTLKEIGAWQ